MLKLWWSHDLCFMDDGPRRLSRSLKFWFDSMTLFWELTIPYLASNSIVRKINLPKLVRYRFNLSTKKRFIQPPWPSGCFTHKSAKHAHDSYDQLHGRHGFYYPLLVPWRTLSTYNLWSEILAENSETKRFRMFSYRLLFYGHAIIDAINIQVVT